MIADAPTSLVQSPDFLPRTARLRTYNAVMGLLHAAQGVAVLLLANDFSLPVTATYLNDAPGAGEPPPPSLIFDSPIAFWVAAFLFLSALWHWVLAFAAFGWYRDMLGRGVNFARWWEYSVSASIMIVLIAQLTGISDIAALLAVFGVNAAMIFFGFVQERYERPGGSLVPFWLGCVVGAVPWVVVAIYLLQPGADTAASPPTFVVVIFVSLFVFFNCFAINQWLQYRQIGRWRDYLVGESTYVLLSLVAKSALAWQVFAGTLAG